MNKKNLKLAFLINRYPTISDGLVLHEILFLKSKGFDICVASINQPEPGAKDLTNEEKIEIEKTYYLKRGVFGGAFRAHLSTLLTQPLNYFSGLAYALKIDKLNFKKIVENFGCFYQAVRIGSWMRTGERKHLHVHLAAPESTVALIAGRIFEIKFSMTVHAFDELYEADDHLLKTKIKEADFICCVGVLARNRLMQISSPANRHKFEIISPGIVTETPNQENSATSPGEVFEPGSGQIKRPAAEEIRKKAKPEKFGRRKTSILKKLRRKTARMKLPARSKA